MSTQSSRGFAALFLVFLFFVLSLPSLVDWTRYHGDERFYTDAAIGMVQSGDFLTPRYPDGELRFEKPLFSYLVLVGSYQLFDVSLLSSRLPFLVAGALLVGLTWYAGWLLLRDGEVALLAAVIIASCHDILILSTRSTPDILLCLFLTLGFIGFYQLHKQQAALRAAHARAWLGVGFAAAVKGGLGVLLVLYAFIFAAFAKDRLLRIRRLIDPIFTPLGCLLALAGFGVYAFAYGGAVLERSANDQVVKRLASMPDAWAHFWAYLPMPFEHLLPWSLLLLLCVVRGFPALTVFARQQAFFLRFSLGWIATLLLLFSAGDLVRGRYLAPMYPLLAILFAAMLMALVRDSQTQTFLYRLSRGLLALAVAAGVVLACAGIRFGLWWSLVGSVIAFFAFVGFLRARSPADSVALVALGVTALLIQTLGESTLRASFSRTPVPALADCLAASDLPGRRVAQWGTSAHLASKLRVATAGRIPIDGFQRGVSEPDWDVYNILISDQPFPAAVAAAGFRVETCGEAWRDSWTLEEVLALVRAENDQSVLTSRAQPYYFAVRERESGQSRP